MTYDPYIEPGSSLRPLGIVVRVALLIDVLLNAILIPELIRQRSLVQDLASDPASVSEGDATSVDDTVSTLSHVLLGALIITVVLFVIWFYRARVNADGFDDLAIGVPGEGLDDEHSSQGIVQVVFGSSSGLTTAGNLLLSEAVDPDRPVGIQHQLDDIRFVQQPAESAELALHAGAADSDGELDHRDGDAERTEQGDAEQPTGDEDEEQPRAEANQKTERGGAAAPQD